MTDIPYERGYQAYCAEQSLNCNPYPPDTQEWREWETGWKDAMYDDVFPPDDS